MNDVGGAQHITFGPVALPTMARSKEAIRRRAGKRNRSVEEQRKADGEAHQKQLEREQQIQRVEHDRSHTSTDNPMKEPGAWICPGCGNHNFASRHFCHSKTCDEQQPASSSAAVERRPKKARHNPATSKTLAWGAQADQNTIGANKLLRQRFLETQGEGMTLEEQERAKILIARDKRKKEKKQMRNGKASTVSSTPSGETEAKSVAPNSKVNDKETRKRNKALRKQYLKTNGNGMSQEETERAMILIARDERKRQKRAYQKPTDEKGKET